MDFKKLTDEELVALSKSNAPNAIDELFERYKRIVLAVARSYFLSGGDTEDLVQEGLVAVFKAINTYNGKASFKSYAYLCIKSRILTVIKSSNTNKNQPLKNYVSLSGVEDGDLDKSKIVMGTSPNPEDKYIDDETVCELKQKISTKLSGYELKILKLYLEGYSQKEISEKVGKKEKSVDNALQRIKRKVLVAIKG